MNTKFAAYLLLLLLLLMTIPSLAGDRTIINKSGSAVTSVMISPSGSSNWIYISTGMAAEGKFMFTLEDNAFVCSYELKFTDDKGKEYFMGSIDICSEFEITLDGHRAEETSVRFLNQKDTK